MYLRSNGATVEVMDDPDRATYRRDRGIGDDLASCHTALVEEYLVEGHVPAEAIAQLVARRPAGIGLALPAMPADSPGMGGSQRTWITQPVVLVGADGSASAWAY